MTEHIENIADNLDSILQLIQQYKKQVEPQLIAVSKRQSVDKIEEAINAGQRVFGENKVQEAYDKWPALKQQFPNCILHLIGPLQTNKVPNAVSLFDVIQTVDRRKLALSLAKEMQKQGKFPKCFIQVNIGNEPQKSGINVEESDDFITYCQDNLKLPIIGLMCIPPKDTDPEPYFNRLSGIAKKHHLPKLSMGMSSDYIKALHCGATHIRVGEAIFGKRQNN